MSESRFGTDMAENATSLAIIDADGRVVTFVRMDVPQFWQSPEGCTAVPDDELPAGWQYAPDSSPVPSQVSSRQIRLWLVKNGFGLSAIETAINAIPDQSTRESVRVEWEYAPYVERSHPWLVPLASALGLDEAAVNQAFREASAL